MAGSANIPSLWINRSAARNVFRDAFLLDRVTNASSATSEVSSSPTTSHSFVRGCPSPH